MVFLSSDRLNAGLLARFARRQFAPNRFDLVALALRRRGGGAGASTARSR